MLALGFTHFQTTMILGIINIGFVIFAYSMRDMGMLKLSLLVFVMGMLVAYIPSLFLYLKKKEVVRRLNSINRYRT